MHLFLEGPRGVGKSNLLRKALSHYPYDLSGFVVQRLVTDGEQVGFRVVILENGFPPWEAKYSPDLPDVFIRGSEINASILDEAIAKVEEAGNNPHNKLLLLDEIGGIELVSPMFMDSLLRILSGTTPCIGVFKSFENMKHTAAVLRLGQEYIVMHQNLEGYLREHGQLITLRNDNWIDIYNSVIDYLLGLSVDVERL